jgi:hypothetical protein
MEEEHMKNNFKQYSDKLPALMEQLRNSDLIATNDFPTIPSKGIYVFYEDKKPIYVGRSNRLTKRLREHHAEYSTHYSATFAFKLAKKKAGEKGVDLHKTQKALAKDPVFANIFREERQRVSKMSVRVIEIEDQITQYLFETYAVLELGTTDYNDFWTH